MTSIIIFLFWGINSLHYCIKFYGLQQSLIMFFIIFTEIMCLIFIIIFVMKLQSKDSIEFRILKYSFEYPLERYYSFFVCFFSISLFVSFALYCRINSFTKNINLIELKKTFMTIYFNYPFMIIFCNILLFLASIFLLILIIKSLQIYIHKEFVKLHIYYLDKSFYFKSHQIFLQKYCLDNLIINKLDNIIIKLFDFCALGYYKDYENYTEKEQEITKFYFLQNKIFTNIFSFTKILFYNLHYLFFLIFILYDLYYCSFNICFTFKYLPFMFLYQGYIVLSKFVKEKPCTEVCANANMFFYHKIIFLNKNTMFLDGELYEIPLEFPKEFLKYEASGFTKP